VSAKLRLFWLIVRHDLRLTWRGWLGKFSDTFVNTGLAITLFILQQVIFAIVLTLAPRATPAIEAMVWSGALFFIFTGAMTNVQLARPDSALLLSSPVPPQAVLAARIASQTLASISMVLFFVLPAVNVYAVRFGPGYLAGYVVLLLLGLAGTTAAVATTLLLTKLIGVRRAMSTVRILGFVLVALFIVAIRLPDYRHSAVAAQAAALLGKLATGVPMRWVALAGQGQPLALAGLVLAGLVATYAMAALLERTYLSGTQQENATPSRRRSSRPHRWTGSFFRALYFKELRLLWREPVLLAQLLPTLANLLPLFLGFQKLGVLMLGPVACGLAQILVLALTPLVAGGDEAWDLIRGSPVTEIAARRVKLAAALTLPLLLCAALNLVLAALGHPFLALISFVATLPSALSNGWLVAANIPPTARKGLVKRAKNQESFFATFVGFALTALVASGLWALSADHLLIGAGLIGANWIASFLIFGFTTLKETPDWKFEALRDPAAASK